MTRNFSNVTVHIDGGSRGNPGPAGAGVVISDADGMTLQESGVFLGKATNNVAEYTALLVGLRAAKKLGARRVKIISDSELLVRQMNGRYRVKNAGLRPLYEEAQELTTRFEAVSIHHVRREQNTDADRMVNQAINLKRNV